MALFHEMKVGSSPAMHALVIGVGGYTHLNSLAVQNEVGVLKSLTSPPRSALAFAEFLKTSAGWTTPLATIDLLISANPADPIPIPATAGTATQANIQTAFSAWEARCNANPDHVAQGHRSGVDRRLRRGHTALGGLAEIIAGTQGRQSELRVRGIEIVDAFGCAA